MRVSHGSAIMGHNVGDPIRAHFPSLDSAQLELPFSLFHTLQQEPSFAVIKDPELFSCLFDREDIHDAEREGLVTSTLAIHLDILFLVS